jgi:arginase
MGMAHMLGVEGAVPELVAAGPRAPLLEPADVLLFGWGPEQATPFEREAVERLGLATVPVDEVAADPEGAAAAACARMEQHHDRVLVHFDVDVIDFTDVPLSENTGRNEGMAYEHALRALDRLLASACIAGVTVTELNPDHTEAGAGTLERFAERLAGAVALSAAAPRADSSAPGGGCASSPS